MSGDLEFTGERFTPECVREIRYEHYARYAFAAQLAHGKRVLDVACGEGYGSALLAGRAASVFGVDISAAAVAHAAQRYGHLPNVRFARGDCTQLQVAAGGFDLATCFETLEHVQGQQALVAGLARALGSDGMLLVSSPDKHTYSDVSGFRNEFHVRELYRHELLALLAPHFSHVRLYGQKLLFQSALWNVERAPRTVAAATAGQDALRIGLDYAPLYFVAVCANRPLPTSLADLYLYGDHEESVYAHYNGEVRQNMAAGARIAELEAEVARLRALLDPPSTRR